MTTYLYDAATLATWRAAGRKRNGYVYVHQPATLFRAQVTGAPEYTGEYNLEYDTSYPIASITYSTIYIGSESSVKVGMTGRVVSSTGVIKGYFRVRTAPPDNSVIGIGETSQGVIELSNEDWVEVLDEYRLWSKVPRIITHSTTPVSVTFYKDYDLAYSDQGLYPPPVCNAGPHYAGFVDESTSEATVAFDLTSSFAIAAGASIASYSADLVDGVVVSGSVASGVFSATFYEGVRWVHLTVTDTNAKSHTAHVLVAALNRDLSPTASNVTLSSVTLTGEGAETSLTLLADYTGWIDGAMVIYFEEEYWENSSTPESFGGIEGREHIKFVGWMNTETIEINPETSEVTVTAVNSLRRMASMVAFSQSTLYTSSPARWDQMANHTLFRHIWYLLHWHSTILELCDFHKPNWANVYTHTRLDVDGGDLYSQISPQAEAARANLMGDRYGGLWMEMDPNLLMADERDIGVLLPLDEQDWGGDGGISFERLMQPAMMWIQGYGIISSSTTAVAVAAIAPGKAPNQGTSAEQLNRQLVASQLEINWRTGLFYAKKNNPIPRVTINILNGGMLVEPAWRYWVELSLGADTNKRGVSFDSDRFIVLEVTAVIDYENGVATETWGLEPETYGPPGSTVILPGYTEWQTTLPTVPPIPKRTPTTEDPQSILTILKVCWQ